MKSLREKAMDYLARREHSRGELASKLSAKAFDREEIDVVLDKLESDGLLSDQRFSECFVRSRAQAGFGPRRIAVELQQRKVSDAHQRDAFLQLACDWRDILQQQWQKRRATQVLGEARSYAKQMRYFVNRGFSPDMIKQVLQDDF